MARRLRAAHLKERGVIEDVDYQHPRGLDRKLVRTLSSSDWVRQHHSVLLLGPTGIGKTWLACALAQKACRDGFSVLHRRTSELFRELAPRLLISAMKPSPERRRSGSYRARHSGEPRAMEPALLGVLDSSVLIAAERRKLTAAEAVESIQKRIGDVPLALSVVTIAEVGHGIYCPLYV